MLLELLTPLIIASEPVRIDVPHGKYDHESQVMKYEVAQYQQPTFGGTRTYLPDGKPFDNDND